MTVAEPEDTGPAALSALEALGDQDWRSRQVAVARLVKEQSPLVVARVIEIVRDEHRNLSRLNAAIQVLTRTECDVVPALLPLLVDPDADARAYVALTLGERGDVRAIAALVATLADPETNVRVHAVEALGKLRAAAAVDALMQFVEHPHFELAFPALDALTAIGDERIAHRLYPLLDNLLLKSAAVDALGTLGSQESIPPLLKLVGDPTVATGVIASAVHQIHNRHAARYGSGRDIAEIVKQAAGPLAVAALRSSIPVCTTGETAAVVAVLGWIPGSEAESSLLDLLDRPDLRRACVNALTGRGTAVIPAVLARFERSEREMQLSLIELCGRLGDRRSLPLLLQCLGNEDDELVVGSLEALARIGDARAYSSAKTFLGHSSLRVRQAAVNLLNALGHPDTANDVQRLLRESDPHVCASALKVATYFGFPICIDAVLACCDHADAQVQKTAIEHLPCLDDERIVSRLQQALGSTIPALRAAATGALGEIEAPAAIDLLEKALDHRDVWVRYFAVRSLTRHVCSSEIREKLLSLALGDSAMQVRIAAVEALKADAMPILADLTCSNDIDLAVAALKALGATHSQTALPTLQLALRSSQSNKQVEAIRALGESGLQGAIEPLRQMALGRDRLLAEEACLALALLPFPESCVSLLEAMNAPGKRPAAVGALIKLGKTAIPVLACRLHELDLDVRRAVIEMLIAIRSSEALEVLEIALADKEPAVRFSALAGLANLRQARREMPEVVGSEGVA